MLMVSNVCIEGRCQSGQEAITCLLEHKNRFLVTPYVVESQLQGNIVIPLKYGYFGASASGIE